MAASALCPPSSTGKNVDNANKGGDAPTSARPRPPICAPTAFTHKNVKHRKKGGAPLLKSFVIVIFGGLGSISGAIVGGLLIGLAETLTGAYISYAFKDVFTFLIMIFVLLLRPNGLLGKRAA